MARIFRKLAQLLDVDLVSTPPGDGDALVYDDGSQKWVPGAGGGGGGAPTDVNYLVGTADSGLSNEIVVGTTPGGELGGTWASPTVDATHSGSSHASVQAAAEATAAGALSAHASDTTGVHGISDTSALLDTGDIGSSVAAQSHVHAGEDITSGTVADARIASTIARDSEVTAAISAHEADTTSVHGITDTSALETTSGAQAKVDAHVNDTSAAHAASSISVDSTALSGTATNAQASLEELDNLLDDHSARHENGGADEISLAGLSGDPADTVNKSLVDAKGDLLVGTADNTVARLAAGTDGHVLTAASGETAGVKWAAASGSGSVASDAIWDTKGDMAAATGADTAVKVAVGSPATLLTADPGATAGVAWRAALESHLYPAGALAQTMDRHTAVTTSTPSSGTLRMVAIALPAGITVTSITFVTGATALTRGTGSHLWAALFDSSRALLGQSTDDTATAWGSNSPFTFTLASPVAITTQGLYYVGVVVVSGSGGTQPVLAASNGSSAVTGIAPIMGGNSSGSLTTTAPDPAAAITAAGILPYAYVS